MVRVAAGLADTRVVEFAARTQRPVHELRECLRAVITCSVLKGSVLLIDCSQLVAEEQLIFLCVGCHGHHHVTDAHPQHSSPSPSLSRALSLS